ncbi:transmembrane protein 56-B-like protein [Tanacetum coccineum]
MNYTAVVAKAVSSSHQDVWIRHGDQALKMQNGFEDVVRSEHGAVAAVECGDKKVTSSGYEVTGIVKAINYSGHSICVCSLPMTATVAQLAVEHKNFGPLKSNGVEVRSNKGFRFGFDEFESLDSIHIAIKVETSSSSRCEMTWQNCSTRKYLRHPKEGRKRYIHVIITALNTLFVDIVGRKPSLLLRIIMAQIKRREKLSQRFIPVELYSITSEKENMSLFRDWECVYSVRFGKFLAKSESGANGHIWKEIMKTIHVDADKHRKEIGEAYVVLSSSRKQLFFKALQQPFISATFDYMYIKSYSFRLFSSLPGVLTPVRGESLKILNGFDVSLPVSHLLWSSQSFGHQKAINGFDMPLPVAVCSGLVNPLAPRKVRKRNVRLEMEISAQSNERMTVSKKTALAFKSYQNQAQVLVKTYLLADAFMPYTSVLGGIFASKMVYDLTQLISTFYFRTYAGLTKIQRIEWNNRGMSSVHAIFITAMSLYFVFWSDLYSDQYNGGPITFRSSPLSTFALGVSVGYFLSDLGMIFWLYPALGGLEYVVHHTLSAIAVGYSMYTGEGQLYTFMVLISELTTPEINLRWYLDTAGLKKSSAYLINGVVIFFAWMVIEMHPMGFLLVFTVPSVLESERGEVDEETSNGNGSVVNHLVK